MRYFTPGPSQMHPVVGARLAEAIAAGIPSISHRSRTFTDIVAHTNDCLRQLLDIPEGYSIWFFSSANEVWERLLQNCVDDRSFHLVNGDFSAKFYDFARRYRLRPSRQEAAFGEGFRTGGIAVPEGTELIAAIANETSSGVQTRPEVIHGLAERYPDSLVVVDVVSAVPAYELDLSRVDGAYFSVQKGFGMPAGLGVLIAGPRLLARAKEREAAGKVTGSYHRFSSLDKYARKLQTPETPNVLAIWLLGQVAASMLEGEGMAGLRREHRAKKEALWSAFEDFPGLRHFVAEEFRSETVVVLDCERESGWWIGELRKRGFEAGAGYGDRKARQLRIANFPAMGLKDVEELLAAMREIAEG